MASNSGDSAYKEPAGGAESMKNSATSSSDYEEIIHLMEENIQKPYSTEKLIPKNGGSIELLETKVDFDSGAFDEDTLVSLTLRFLLDIPEEYYPISSAIYCNTSEKPFKKLATIRLPIHILIQGGDVTILQMESQSSWKEFRTVHCSEGTPMTFRVPHFSCIIAVLKRHIPWPWPIKAQHMIYYSKDRALFCGFVSIDDKLVAKSCDDLFEERGFEGALVLPDIVIIKPHERFSYRLQIEHPIGTQLRPHDHGEVIGAMLQDKKFVVKKLTIDPIPGPQERTILLTVRLQRPNLDEKAHGLRLFCR